MDSYHSSHPFSGMGRGGHPPPRAARHTGQATESTSAEARRLWQRLLGVLELIVGGGQLLFYFFSDNQTVTSIILAVMILAAVCILGPYYHWRKQEKENTQE